jgi:Ca2+/Na+ antiporter
MTTLTRTIMNIRNITHNRATVYKSFCTKPQMWVVIYICVMVIYIYDMVIYICVMVIYICVMVIYICVMARNCICRS